MPQQFDEPLREVLHLLLIELEDHHVPDHHEHLVENGQALSLKQFLLPAHVAGLADDHHLHGVAFFKVNTLKQDALPVLYFLPEEVLLEEVDDVDLLDLAVLLGVAHVVGHQKDHELLQHKRVSAVVALHREDSTDYRNYEMRQCSEWI